jgi:HEAT repeat protein
MPLIRKDAAAASALDTPAGGLEDLKSSSDEKRWAATRQLARDPSNAAALGAALAVETDPRVREAMFTGLAQIQTPEAVGFILQQLRSKDAAVRAGALDALNAIPKALEAQLPALLRDPDPEIRILLCDIVRRLPGPTATHYLCDMLAHEALPNVCAAAVEALAEVGDETALPTLAQCAARFGDEPFLLFSIKIASNRVAEAGVLGLKTS